MTIEIKHQKFLQAIEDYVKQYPEVTPYMNSWAARGLEELRSQERDRSCDMENLAYFALQKRNPKAYKQNMIQILKKWKDYNSLVWDERISELELECTQKSVNTTLNKI